MKINSTKRKIEFNDIQQNPSPQKKQKFQNESPSKTLGGSLDLRALMCDTLKESTGDPIDYLTALVDLLLDEDGNLITKNINLLKTEIQENGLHHNLDKHEDEIVRRLDGLEKCEFFKSPLPKIQTKEIRPELLGLIQDRVPLHKEDQTSWCVNRAFLMAALHPIRQSNGGYCFAIAALRTFMTEHPDLVYKAFLQILKNGEIHSENLPSPINLNAHIHPETERQSDLGLIDMLLKFLILGSANYCRLDPWSSSSYPLSAKERLIESVREELLEILSETPKAKDFVKYIEKRLSFNLCLAQHSLMTVESIPHMLGLSFRQKNDWLYLTNYAEIDKYLFLPLCTEAKSEFEEAATALISNPKERGLVFQEAIKTTWEKMNAEIPEQTNNHPVLEMEGGYSPQAISAVFGHDYQWKNLADSSFTQIFSSKKVKTVIGETEGHSLSLHLEKCATVSETALRKSGDRFLSKPISPQKKRSLFQMIDLSPTKNKQVTTYTHLFEINNDPEFKKDVVETSFQIQTFKFVFSCLDSVLATLNLSKEEQKTFKKNLPEWIYEEQSYHVLDLQQILSSEISRVLKIKVSQQELLSAICTEYGLPLLFQVGDTNYNESSREGSLHLTSNLEGGMQLYPLNIELQNLGFALSPKKKFG